MVLPFLIGFVRRGITGWRRDIGPAVLALAVSAIVIAPLYSHRYFTGHRAPAAMDWQRPLDLAAARASRDAAPLRVLSNVAALPDRRITESQYPVVDSFFNSIWLHTWKRDGCLGIQPEPSITVSNFYIVAFPLPLLCGTAWFILRQRRISEPWRHVGWILLFECGSVLRVGRSICFGITPFGLACLQGQVHHACDALDRVCNGSNARGQVVSGDPTSNQAGGRATGAWATDVIRRRKSRSAGVLKRARPPHEVQKTSSRCPRIC